MCFTFDIKASPAIWFPSHQSGPAQMNAVLRLVRLWSVFHGGDHPVPHSTLRPNHGRTQATRNRPNPARRSEALIQWHHTQCARLSFSKHKPSVHDSLLFLPSRDQHGVVGKCWGGESSTRRGKNIRWSSQMFGQHLKHTYSFTLLPVGWATQIRWLFLTPPGLPF